MPYILGKAPYEHPSVAASSTAIIEDGTTWKGETRESQLEINGVLKIEGANKNSIVFTSLADSGPAEWDGILVNTNGRIEGGGFTVRYGGKGPGRCSVCAGIHISGGMAELSNVLLENNYRAGMRISSGNGTSTLSNFEFRDHTSPAGSATALIVSNSQVILTDLIFSNNNANTSPPDLY